MGNTFKFVRTVVEDRGFKTSNPSLVKVKGLEYDVPNPPDGIFLYGTGYRGRGVDMSAPKDKGKETIVFNYNMGPGNFDIYRGRLVDPKTRNPITSPDELAKYQEGVIVLQRGESLTPQELSRAGIEEGRQGPNGEFDYKKFEPMRDEPRELTSAGRRV